MRALLDRSGLSYADLEALLATRFVNPDAAVAVAPDSDAANSCDTTKLHIQGLTADVLDRLHRFVRLWRKVGWSIDELDLALCGLAHDGDAPVLTNEILVRLDHLRELRAQLRLSVAQVLALWRPIDTREPGSLYANLFYNPAVFKPQDDDFRLEPDGQELVHADKMLADHTAALAAAFQLDPNALTLLVARTDGKLNLANLSLMYRHAILARQLRLTIPSLLIAIEMIGIEPFRADHTEDTLRFVAAVSATRGSAFDFPQLDYLLRHRASAAASFVPTEETLSQALADLRTHLANAEGPSDAETQELRRSATIDRVSAALRLPADVTAELLEGRDEGTAHGAVAHPGVRHGGKKGLQVFVELLAMDEEPLSRTNARPQFETLEKLLKIAGVIRALELPGSRLGWLFGELPWLAQAPDPQPDATSLPNWWSLIQLDGLRKDLALKPGALEGVLGALSATAAASDAAARLQAKQDLVDALAAWLGWARDDLETLIGTANDLDDRGLLGARLPEDYRTELLVRLNGAMRLTRRLGATAAQVDSWCAEVLGAAEAKAIRDAAKAKYSDEAWQGIVVPLQDALRERLRDALVGYLVAHPGAWATNLQRVDARDLYAHYLIDVEMSACQLTSRIKQGISSVQLFAQRCLMGGLEPGVQTADPKWREWTNWMNSFRVWEANRKIWLYPENWIEPELRDDKSPFFRELENELLQSDLDNAAAEQALMRYLEKLEQVAHLEIAGTYEDNDKTLHVFGRTEHTPRAYFYRRREKASGRWTAWEKLELDIEGDHLIPVVWNRKLMLIWPIFKEKQDEKAVKMPAVGDTLKAGKRYWELQLGWSELQYGRWSGKKLSDAVRFQASIGDTDILFGNAVRPPDFMARDTSPGLGTGTGTGGGGGGGGGGGINPGGGGSTSADGSSRPVPQSLLTFKAFASEEVLTVRAYLRLDYAAPDAMAGADLVYPVGEFRFSGCRKVVTTAYRSQMINRIFALAPRGTKFDAMWLDEIGSGLTMLDGTFTERPTGGLTDVANPANLPAPLPQDASGLNAQRIDIPVLSSAASPFRVLPPHQDPQFIGDRPFFYMDTQRAFMVTSTGHSGPVVNPLNWVLADVATLGMASAPAADGSSETSTAPSRGLTVLAPGANGKRIARAVPPVNLTPAPAVHRGISRFWSDRAYTFRTFHHPYACELAKRLDQSGIDALLSLDSQGLLDAHAFDAYSPTNRVVQPYPVDDVEFQAGGAYELYNWELFFHVPLLIATRLSANQRYAEAQRWFHCIFDPTGETGGDVPQRYWRTKPFYDRLSGDYEQESVEAIEQLAAAEGVPEWLKVAVEAWREQPFNPYAVARLRTTAFQKTVVMKYIDNLIAWGDRLFRADTMETINEATQLYVLAAEILGRRPDVIERKAHTPIQTFNSLRKVGLLGNSLEQIELLISDAGEGGSSGDGADTLVAPKVLYFGVQENDKLLGYWDTVADRLFKVRHCMNIEGRVRQLPLFEPPIDPALLVRAQAAGLSLADVLSDITVSTPHYRFAVMLQKASEVAAEVRNLGAALLSALEKRDAEALATLRSGQELQLLTAMRDVRVRQVDEARTSVAALERSRDMAQARMEYYESREFMNAEESVSRKVSANTRDPIVLSAAYRYLAGKLAALGALKLGAPTTAGTEVGFDYAARAIEADAGAIDASVNVQNLQSQLVGRLGEYRRRQDDWNHQANLATIELKQIDQQLTAAQIRLAIAEQELRNHDRQIDNAAAVDEFMRGKYTNADLYQWMIGQVSALYFQGYQLAYDLAKRAERCMQHELGLAYGETSFVRFGSWDSLKKGLFAGDLLAQDLKRLDVAYMERNIRVYELTKHVSLVSLKPEQLIALKETGTCQFEVPEWLFDLDTPGHFMRRLEMVSLTIPCVIGPYTTIHCKLQLVKSCYRRNAALVPGYARRDTQPDDRFIDDRKVREVESIVTSTAQNDAGLFDASKSDGRYLPFEGSGAISTWRLDLPKEFKTFDYGTITDVILHLRYTACEDEALRDAATASVTDQLGGAGPLLRMFSLRHEFPTEWHRFVNSPASAINSMTVDFVPGRFPYFAQGRQIVICQANAIGRSKWGTAPQIAIAPGQAAPSSSSSEWTGQQDPGPWTIGTSADPKSIEDVFVVVTYTV